MSEQEIIARRVVMVLPLLMRNLGADLRCFGSGLAPSHIGLMGVLSKHSCSLGELALSQAVTAATISNSVTTLVERGWVERIPSTQDRRVVQVCLTPAGQQVLIQIHKQLEQRIHELIRSLPEDELESLDKGLLVLYKVMEKADWKAPLCEEPIPSVQDDQPLETEI
jgi:MarR family transcriptional regulator, negative regulator of the multidrug operon emrRAB